MSIDLATHNECIAFIRKAFTADREFARLRCSNLERTYTIARKPHTARMASVSANSPQKI
jgi:hypothetical protein